MKNILHIYTIIGFALFSIRFKVLKTVFALIILYCQNRVYPFFLWKQKNGTEN